MTARRVDTATLSRTGGAAALVPRWITRLVWLAVAVTALGALAVGLFFYRGDPEGASRIANREIEAELAPGERVEERVAVRRRYWWDYLRLTHGVLAATDRRLVYLGVPPDPLVRRDDGPLELDYAEFPYSMRLTASPTRGAFGMREGIAIAGGSDAVERFGIVPDDRERLARTLAVMQRAVDRQQAAADAERRATEATVAASRRAIYHLVQRGEALAFVGRRYGVSVESLMVWNALRGPRITVGQRLLVKPEVQ